MFQAITTNRAKTTLIVAFIFVFFVAVVYFISYFLLDLGYFSIVFAVLLSFAISFGAYWNSHKIVLRLHKARPATPQQDAKLKNILEGLCIAAGMPKPALYVMDDPSLNAFATGRNPKNGVICVTTGLLDKLDYYQLEGVVAHELAHIKNYDILLQTVAGIMIGAVVIASNFATRMMFFRGGRSRSSGGRGGGAAMLIVMAVGLILMILAPIAGSLLKMLLSRNREFLADATGATLTRNPEGLASALETIGGSRIPFERANDATEGMYIVTPVPVSGLGGRRRSSSLFSTHPPIEKRVEALRNLR
jgi:heat shock protein HtpX